jgi:hypothetical protein
MSSIDIVELLVLLALGYVAMYLPSFRLAKSEKLTGKELSQKYPEHAWMRTGFLLLYVAWCVIVGSIFFYFLSAEVKIAYLVGWIYASMGIFIGTFAVVTGVCYFPSRSIWMQYVVGAEAREAGRIQVLWSLGVILIASAIAVFRLILS